MAGSQGYYGVRPTLLSDTTAMMMGLPSHTSYSFIPTTHPPRDPTTGGRGRRRAPRYPQAPPAGRHMGSRRRARSQQQRQPQPHAVMVGRGRRRALSGLATATAALGLALLVRTAGGSSFPPPPPMGGGMPPPPPPPPPPRSQGPQHPLSSAPPAPHRAGGYPQQPPQQPPDPMAGAFGGGPLGPSSWQSDGPQSGTRGRPFESSGVHVAQSF